MRVPYGRCTASAIAYASQKPSCEPVETLSHIPMGPVSHRGPAQKAHSRQADLAPVQELQASVLLLDSTAGPVGQPLRPFHRRDALPRGTFCDGADGGDPNKQARRTRPPDPKCTRGQATDQCLEPSRERNVRTTARWLSASEPMLNSMTLSKGRV
jgi:hypothetical protein